MYQKYLYEMFIHDWRKLSPLLVKEFPICKHKASIRYVTVRSSQGRLRMGEFSCSCQLSLSNLDYFSNLATCFGNLKMKLLCIDIVPNVETELFPPTKSLEARNDEKQLHLVIHYIHVYIGGGLEWYRGYIKETIDI